MAMGNNVGSFWRRRKLDREMDTDRTRRRELEDELRNDRLQRIIEQRAEMEAGETGNLSEIEAALGQMQGKPEGDWTPEDAARAGALRRRRAGMQLPEAERMRAEQERAQARLERGAEMGSAELGSLAEIEAALQKMQAKPEGDWTPEDAAMAGALRRRRAGMSTGSGMAKVREIDPEGRELEYQQPLAAIMAGRAQPPGASQGGQQPVTTRPAQGGGAVNQLQPGAVVQQGGQRYRFRGGNPQDPANYEPVQ
jgi:hypothetical protein